MTSISIPSIPYGQLQERLGISQIGQLNDEATVRPTRWQIAIWGLLLVVGLLLFLRGYQKAQIGLYPDESQYIVLAQSLVYSNQFGLINYPGQPHIANYPFGYPLLLAPFVLLWPDNLDVLKALSLIATLANVSLLFWGWRWLTRRSSYWWGIAVAGLYALSPFVVSHSWMVMSEPVFLSFCLAAMILTEQAARRKQGRWWSLLLSIALTFVLFTRTAGAILLLCIALYLLIARGREVWHELAVTMGGIVFWTALVVLGTSVQAQDLLPVKYVSEVAASPATNGSAVQSVSTENRWLARLSFFIAENLAIDVRGAVIPIGGGQKEQEFLAHTGASGASVFIGLAVCGLLLLGFVRWFKQEGLSIFLLFVVPYGAFLIVWLWKGPRLLYPIDPQLQFSFLLAIQACALLGNHVAKRMGTWPDLQRVILPAFVVFLMAASTYKSMNIDDTRLHIGDLQARSNWLRANAKASDIVMSEHPETDYLYAGRKTVMYPDLTVHFQDADLDHYLLKQNVQYILLAPHNWWQTSYTPSYSSVTRQLLPLIASLSARNRLTLVYAEEQNLVKVYKVTP